MEIIKYKDCVTSVSTCHTVGCECRLNSPRAKGVKMMKKIIIITGGRRKSFKKSGKKRYSMKKKSYRRY